MTNKEIKKILENHKHWIKEDIDGWEKMRADLRGADLREVELREADLGAANLRGADLRGADLGRADLREAELNEADLRGVNLGGADLRGAFFRGANLGGADLRGADLRRVFFRGAFFRGAGLGEADLRGADLEGADLRGVNLRKTDLRGTALGVEKINENTKINLPISCPDTGAFTAWKKARGYIIQLEIPAEAKRLSATTRKCRCNIAKVVAIQNIDGTDSGLSGVRSGYDHNFIYKVGETVIVDNFDDNRWNECSTGIHFFITREEAVDY